VLIHQPPLLRPAAERYISHQSAQLFLKVLSFTKKIVVYSQAGCVCTAPASARGRNSASGIQHFARTVGPVKALPISAFQSSTTFGGVLGGANTLSHKSTTMPFAPASTNAGTSARRDARTFDDWAGSRHDPAQYCCYRRCRAMERKHYMADNKIINHLSRTWVPTWMRRLARNRRERQGEHQGARVQG